MPHMNSKQWLINTIINLQNQRNASRSFGNAAVVSMINCDIRYFRGMLRECEGE